MRAAVEGHLRWPVEHWTDALLIRNGRLGAMVWGGVASKLFQLHGQVHGNYTDPDALKALSGVRGLVDDGWFSEATAAASDLLGKPSEPGSSVKMERWMLMFDLYIPLLGCVLTVFGEIVVSPNRSMGELGCTQSLLPLNSAVGVPRLTSYLSVAVRACCELSHGT
ncbi:hypothetical protein MLD38_023312 [Melastoma candidum]|uniref:Uncharacterized protein n=1 Tax=Melastoma candidum TaxID=119954 RepID=A0ACB9QM88_9MYRT|nr:hypothetical protein MLD38_023312 [Melastoma candidum]